MGLVEELKKSSITKLKKYAKDNDIDLYGTSTKDEILETILNFVPIEEFPNVKEKKKEVKKTGEKEAVYSSRNLFWGELGELKVGYNIVAKEDTEKWLTRKEVRKATPEEVAKYYGKV
jgi:hypothetical protein